MDDHERRIARFPAVVVSCDLCGGSDVVALAQGDRFGLLTPIVQCSACGLTFQSPRHDPDGLEAFYRDEYREIYSGGSAPTSWFIDDQRRRGGTILGRVRAAGVPLPGRVLDIGCGAGSALLPFRDAECDVVGIEPGGFGSWGAENLRLDIRQTTDLDSVRALGPFDLVLLSFVLEHVWSPFEMLTNIRGLLSTEGHVYVEVPNLRVARGRVEDYFHVGHLTYFTPDTLRATFKAAGLRAHHYDDQQAYSMWFVARRTDTEPRRASPWQAPPLDDVERARVRLRRQQRIEGVERVVRELGKPLLRAAVWATERAGGRDAAERMHMSLRRAWVRTRLRR